MLLSRGLPKCVLQRLQFGSHGFEQLEPRWINFSNNSIWAPKPVSWLFLKDNNLWNKHTFFTSKAPSAQISWFFNLSLFLTVLFYNIFFCPSRYTNSNDHSVKGIDGQNCGSSEICKPLRLSRLSNFWFINRKYTGSLDPQFGSCPRNPLICRQPNVCASWLIQTKKKKLYI